MQPAQALSGIQEMNNGKILLIQNAGDDEYQQQKTTGALNSPQDGEFSNNEMHFSKGEQPDKVQTLNFSN